MNATRPTIQLADYLHGVPNIDRAWRLHVESRHLVPQNDELRPVVVAFIHVMQPRANRRDHPAAPQRGEPGRYTRYVTAPNVPPMVPSFRARLAADDFLVGTWLTLLDPTVPELLSGSGYDLLVADGEHGSVGTSDLVQMVIATRAAGVPVLYRVAANEPVRIMHALDGGASGVVIPQVRTVADVEKAVAWCRYPPTGLRGIAPRRVSNYGRQAATYMAEANGAVTCCIQIETHEALAALDALLEVPGVDTILVGPNDLAASLGHTGRIDDPEVEAAIAHVIERATAHGIPAGAWTQSTAVALRRRDQGFRWVTISADYGFLVKAADAAVREIREG